MKTLLLGLMMVASVCSHASGSIGEILHTPTDLSIKRVSVKLSQDCEDVKLVLKRVIGEDVLIHSNIKGVDKSSTNKIETPVSYTGNNAEDKIYASVGSLGVSMVDIYLKGCGQKSLSEYFFINSDHKFPVFIITPSL